MNTEQTRGEELAGQTYNRAINGSSIGNELTIVREFADRGIEAHPREDTFTYNVWRNKFARQVRKGEKGVQITTYRKNKDGKTVPIPAYVFHISQTDARTYRTR
tara:strand:- start:133 stop:444 length:312 start_codon:yes stop_codon:yes gene_type:complete